MAPALGWAAATAAVFTAYVRLLGGSLGQVQRFTGPLAKQHRMALLTGACLLSFKEEKCTASLHALSMLACLWH